MTSFNDVSNSSGNDRNNGEDEFFDEQATINIELELAEKEAIELLMNRRREIASRFNRDFEVLDPILPNFRKSFGKRNAFTHFLSENYTNEGCKC